MKVKLLLAVLIVSIIAIVVYVSEFSRTVPAQNSVVTDKPDDIVTRFWSDTASGNNSDRNIGQTPESFYDDSLRCKKLKGIPGNSAKLAINNDSITGNAKAVQEFAKQISSKQLKLNSAKTLRTWENEAIVITIHTEPAYPDTFTFGTYFFLAKDKNDDWRIFHVSNGSLQLFPNFARTDCNSLEDEDQGHN